jgi:hypothetical protein
MFIDCITKHQQLSKLFNESNYDDIFKCFDLKKYKKGEVIWNKSTDFDDKVVMILDGDISEVYC